LYLFIAIITICFESEFALLIKTIAEVKRKTASRCRDMLME
jgi:hypothetical protein